MTENQLTLGAGRRTSAAYGADYLDELGRVIAAHARMRTGTVLEWGMGNSTLFLLSNAAGLGIRRLVALDHKPDYVREVIANLPRPPGFSAHCVDLVGPRRGNADPEPNYATFPTTLGLVFDVVIIDGRRRVECALNALRVCHADSLVLLHDWRRARYDAVHLLYDIIEEGTQYRAMRPRPTLLSAVPGSPLPAARSPA